MTGHGKRIAERLRRRERLNDQARREPRVVTRYVVLDGRSTEIRSGFGR